MHISGGGGRKIPVLPVWRMACDVEGGTGVPVRRHSYWGHRVELRRDSGCLQNEKQAVESQAE